MPIAASALYRAVASLCTCVVTLATVFATPSSAAAVQTQALALPATATQGAPIAAPITVTASDPLKSFRAAHPEAIWPHWFADDRIAWATVGLDAGGVEGLVGTDGTFSPNRNSMGISLWLRNDRTGVLYIPSLDQVTQSLTDGDLPLITTRWTAGGATVTTTVFAASGAADPITPGAANSGRVLVRTNVSASGPAQPWTLYVALRPFGPAGGSSPLHSVSASASTLVVDGNLALVAQTPASRFGALNESAVDASLLAKAGDTPETPSATSSIGMAEGMLAYDTRLGGGTTAAYNFALPIMPAPPTAATVTTLQHLDVPSLQRQVASEWQARLHHVQLSVADPRIRNAFYASLAYMFMAQQGDEIYSGPLSEHAFWFRDAAYTTDALDKAGYAGTVRQMLQLIAASQLPNGRYPPIIEPDGSPQLPLKTEWDTQGEVIFALTDYARQNHALAFLHDVYPGIWAAARFQQSQITAQRQPALQGTPFYGILPAGESAEDLYSANWHHYWDDFWGMAGFQEAANAARMLGFTNDVSWLTADENALRKATLASVEAVKAGDGGYVISNGPEDRTTTAMARSGTPSIWPVEVLDPTSDVVQHSFTTYYIWGVKPYGGAYQHYNGHYWPYADVSLAHAFYRLGMMQYTEQILEWVLSHQTAPNLYAWAEIVRPQTSTFSLGDMPHSWMAAEMILLIRDMLVREDGQAIDIGPFPVTWLPAGGTVSISDFPTALGSQSYRLTRSADGSTLQLTLTGTPPSGGYALRVPDSLAAQTYAINGGPRQDVSGDAIQLPPSAHTVTVTVTTR